MKLTAPAIPHIYVLLSMLLIIAPKDKKLSSQESCTSILYALAKRKIHEQKKGRPSDVLDSLVLLLIGLNDPLETCCETCKTLYLAWNNDLGSLSVGSFSEGFKSLELDDLLVGSCVIELY